MSKFQARTGARPFRVGVAVAAVAALALAVTATPALAVVTTDLALTTNVTQLPSQGGLVATFTGPGSGTQLSTASSAPTFGWFTPGASACPATIPVANTAVSVLASSNVGALASESVTINTPPLTTGSWRFCLYDALNVLAGHSSPLVVVPFGTLNTVTGPAAGGNVVTLTAPGAFTATSFGTEFNTTMCPDKYATASTGLIIAAATTKVSVNALNLTVPTSLTAGAGYYICVYGGTVANTSTMISRTWNTYGAYATTLPAASVAPPNGSSGATGTNITLTTTTGTIPVTGTMGAIFTRNSCPTTNNPTGDMLTSTVTRISTAKVAVAVPSTVVTGPRDATTAWNVCLYSLATSSGVLLTAPTIYSVAPALNLTGVINAAGYDPSGTGGGTASLYPAGGPAQGGTLVQISNLDGIPTAEGAVLQASLGGSPMTNVKAVDSNTITGVTTPHAPGAVNLTITTAAGTKSTLYTLADAAANGGVFNYSYAINVTPNTAPPASAAGVGTNNPTIDIMGAGFSSLNFQDVPHATTGTKAHVLLVDNGWYNQSSGATALTGSTGVANAFTVAAAPVTQCTTVLVIGDNELVCTLDLANTITGNAAVASAAVTSPAAAVPTGTYTVTVINSGGSPALKSASFNYSIVTSGSTFTVSSF